MINEPRKVVAALNLNPNTLQQHTAGIIRSKKDIFVERVGGVGGVTEFTG